NGRDHNHYGFTMWLAGGGVKGGQVYGATDEFGFQAVENKVHVHDLHTTLLHLLGFDHERLTYRYAGRDFRLTDVHGHVVKELIAKGVGRDGRALPPVAANLTITNPGPNRSRAGIAAPPILRCHWPRRCRRCSSTRST